MEFRIFGDITSWSALETWIRKWVDIEDERYVQGKDYQYVVHSVSEPKKETGYWLISIDMGSAGLESIHELFMVFEKLGVKKVEIGSFSMINQNAEPDSIQPTSAPPVG